MNDPQFCELCFQPVGPFYHVRILPATPLDFLGGTATPHHARVPGAQKVACHYCRYTFSNLEPDSTEEAASASENESPVLAPDIPTPTITDSASNLEPCSTEGAEEPADDSKDELPVPTSTSPTLIVTGSTSHPSGLRQDPTVNKPAATFPSLFYRYLDSGKASQRAPPRSPDAVQIYVYSSRAPPRDWLL